MVAGVLVLAIAIWTKAPSGTPSLGRDRSENSGTTPRSSNIAVLYFHDLSPGGELGYLADGLTEDLIHHLSQFPALSVISANGVDALRSQRAIPDSVIDRMGVGTIVSGSVGRFAGILRVHVLLVDAATGRTLASEVIGRPWGDVLRLIDGVVEEVVATLRVEIGRTVRARRWQVGTTEPTAWTNFRRAIEVRRTAQALLDRGEVDAFATALATADSLLTLAERLDPAWVDPVVERGWVAYQLGFLGIYRDSDDREEMRRWFELATDHAHRALSVDSTQAAPHELLGVVADRMRLFTPGMGPAATNELLQQTEAELRTAVTLEPARARAWSELSSLLFEQGRFAEAQVAANAAFAADAYLEAAPQIVNILFETSFELGEDAKAAEWCRASGERFTDWGLYANCALTLAAWTTAFPLPPRAAREVAEASIRALPGSLRPETQPRISMLLAGVYARNGMAGAAKDLMLRVESAHPDSELSELKAAVYLLIGEPDRAAREIQRYLENNPGERDRLLHGRKFRALADHPMLTEERRKDRSAATG